MKLTPIKYILLVLSAIFGFIVFISCAKVGSPYGGPKDVDPPVVVKTKPPANSVNFGQQKKILIIFDEFIKFKDIYQEMIVSPPVEGNPVALLRGKGIVVEMPEEAVYDTTTYTINFGNAIADNNEGNVLKNYQYVFSLKDYIDSMNVEGKIVNAFNHKPDEDRMLVMLYRNLNDSAPLIEKPAYVGRSDKEGNFIIPNLETGIYRVFALKDANGNMIYDLPTEQIAFADSAIELTPEKFMEDLIIRDSLMYDSLLSLGIDTSTYDPFKTDTNTSRLILSTSEEFVFGDDNMHDSLNFELDTASSDTLEEQKTIYSFNTKLRFFSPIIYNQYLIDYKRERRDQLIFIFNEAPKDTIEVTPINYSTISANWFVMDAGEDMDTLKLWLTDTNMIGLDSLQVELCYSMYDTVGDAYNQADTLLMRFVEENKNTPRKKRTLLQKEEEVDTVKVVERPKLKLKSNAGNKFDLNRRIAISSDTPLAKYKTDSVKLFKIKDDTVLVPVKYTIEPDTTSLYKVLISYLPESETKYQIFFPDSVIHDIYNETNDTTIFNFSTQSENHYGSLSVNMLNVIDSLVVQLLDKNEKVLKQKFINKDQYITFDYLNPGEYYMKLIVDWNGNGEWDTGDYHRKLQPEEVIYYPDMLEVRSNWEVDFPWEVRCISCN